MAAAFATILTSHESSAIGSVTRQVPTPDHMFNMLATDLRTAVPTTVRRGLTTGSAPTKSTVGGDEVREVTDILFRSLKDKDLQASFDTPDEDPGPHSQMRQGPFSAR